MNLGILGKLCKSTPSEKSKIINECEIQREVKAVNKILLTDTMKEWTPTINNLATDVCSNRKTVEVCKQGEKNILETHKENISREATLGEGIMKILHSDLAKSLQDNTTENNFVNEINRLQTERANRMRYEQMMSKNRKSHKIKSKNFHRHMKRRDIKEYLRKEEQNPDSLKDKIEEFEKLRANERISQKHKIGGKFAKINKLRAKYDPKAREVLNMMHEKGQELTKKFDVDDEDDEEEYVSDLSEEQESGNEELVAVNNEEFVNSKTHKAGTFTEKFGLNSNNSIKKKIVSEISTSQLQFFNYDENLIEDSSEVVTTDQAKFIKDIYQVYQGDEELAAEFEKEKNELVDKEKPKDIQLFLPGWGTWTGQGYEAADKIRKKRGLIKAPDSHRKDKKKTRVWIREGVHDELKKHLIKAIPYPYNTVEQFNLSRKELVSGVFNLQTVHRDIIKPKFINKAGRPIYPLKKQDKHGE